jgi:lipopolysaccharide/colanic/teichoic acid biosynthesis glycosyltransferase
MNQQHEKLVDLTARRRAQLRTARSDDSERTPVLAIGDLDRDRIREQAAASGYAVTTFLPEMPDHRPVGSKVVVLSPDQLGARGEPRPGWLDEVDEIFVAVGSSNPFHPVIPPRLERLKRLVDVVSGVIALTIAAPVIAAAAVWIRLDSKGPVIFRQTRVGRDGRQFSMLKLRTMEHENDDSDHRRYVRDLMRGEAEATDGVYRLHDDPRVTRAGRRLRQLSIDELPQLWNVVRGDMSMIGPRPNSLHETALYDAHAWERLRVKPGMTGLWQVEARGLVSFEEMVDLDVRYWETWSLWNDIKLLLRTPVAVLQGRGAG